MWLSSPLPHHSLGIVLTPRQARAWKGQDHPSSCHPNPVGQPWPPGQSPRRVGRWLRDWLHSPPRRCGYANRSHRCCSRHALPVACTRRNQMPAPGSRSSEPELQINPTGAPRPPSTPFVILQVTSIPPQRSQGQKLPRPIQVRGDPRPLPLPPALAQLPPCPKSAGFRGPSSLPVPSSPSSTGVCLATSEPETSRPAKEQGTPSG